MNNNYKKQKLKYLKLIIWISLFSLNSTILKAQQYCGVSHQYSYDNCSYTYGWALTGVMLNGLDYSRKCTSDPYKYIGTEVATTTLAKGSEYTISIITNEGSGYTIYGGAWIDFNNDITFQPEESLGKPYAQTNNGGKTIWTYKFKVPCNAKSGIVRLRTRTDYNTVMTANHACGSVYGYGNTIDFDVTIGNDQQAVANFQLPVTGSIYVNSGAMFVNNNQTGYVSHEWSVDDGNGFKLQSTDVNFNAYFSTAGTYQVRLKSSNCSSSAITTKTVQVLNPTTAPTPNFISNITKIEVKPGLYFGGEDVYFYDLTTGGPESWYWSIESPDIDELDYFYFISEYDQNPFLISLDTGYITICLEASNAIGTGKTCKKDYLVIDYPENSGGGSTGFGNKYENIICEDVGSYLDSGIIYDNGGEDNYINNSQVCSFTIAPCDASEITLYFDGLEIDCRDFLRIYDGPDNRSKELASYTRVNSTPSKPIVATSGFVTIEFEVDANTYYCYNYDDGFAIRWQVTKRNNDGGPKADFRIANYFNGDIIACGAQTEVKFTETSTGSRVFLTNQWIFDYNPGVSYPRGFMDATGTQVSHNYSVNKTYYIRLVTQSCEGYDTIVKSFNLTTATTSPLVDFDASKPVLYANETTVLTDNSAGGCSGNWDIVPRIGWEIVSGSLTSDVLEIKFLNKGRYHITRNAQNLIGSSSLTKSDYIRVIEYCIPSSMIKSSEVGISKVVIGDVENISTVGESDYQSFASLGTFDFKVGYSYNMEVYRSSFSDNLDRYIYVDWNRDGIFDNSEIITSQLASKSVMMSATITVPDYTQVEEGLSRIRVISALSGYGIISPCGPLYVGEVEDYFINIIKDKQAPVLTLLGANPFEMEVAPTYTDFGAVAMDNEEGDISARIISENDVIPTLPGNYSVKYEVTDNSGNKTIASRLVVVKEDFTSPEITIVGGNSVQHEVNTPFVLPQAVATDNPGNNPLQPSVVLNNVNIAQLGTYDVVYAAEDGYGNASYDTLKVEIVDGTNPTIILNGTNPAFVQLETPFVDLTEVSDNYYTEVTGLTLTKNGNVNSSVPGEYVIEYTATDGSGNVTVLNRTYQVTDIIKPVFNPASELIVVDVNSNFTEPGVTATDNIGTPNIKRDGGGFDIGKLGTYKITYTAEDGFGNTSTFVRTIVVIDSEAPQLYANVVEIPLWSDFDPMDNNIQVIDNYYSRNDFINSTNDCKLIVISNEVRTSDPGIYFVVYQAIDGSGNTSIPYNRMVKVGESTTGIDKNAFSNSISVYPNPSTGLFNITFTSETVSSLNDLKVTLINSIGERIISFDNSKLINGTLQIDLSNFASGIYYLDINDGTSVANKKIVLTR